MTSLFDRHSFWICYFTPVGTVRENSTYLNFNCIEPTRDTVSEIIHGQQETSRPARLSSYNMFGHIGMFRCDTITQWGEGAIAW